MENVVLDPVLAKALRGEIQATFLFVGSKLDSESGMAQKKNYLAIILPEMVQFHTVIFNKQTLEGNEKVPCPRKSRPAQNLRAQALDSGHPQELSHDSPVRS